MIIAVIGAVKILRFLVAKCSQRSTAPPCMPDSLQSSNALLLPRLQSLATELGLSCVNVCRLQRHIWRQTAQFLGRSEPALAPLTGVSRSVSATEQSYVQLIVPDAPPWLAGISYS